MTENLKIKIPELIEKYTGILKDQGDPNEAYKYVAINTFKKNWKPDVTDFHQMFRASFSKGSNLLYQNSWGFIEKAAQHFPGEVRVMFGNLYDETVEITKRITSFQAASESLLPKLRQQLNKLSLNAQQDERTLAVYLAFRFPDKYIV